MVLFYSFSFLLCVVSLTNYENWVIVVKRLRTHVLDHMVSRSKERKLTVNGVPEHNSAIHEIAAGGGGGGTFHCLGFFPQKKKTHTDPGISKSYRSMTLGINVFNVVAVAIRSWPVVNVWVRNLLYVPSIYCFHFTIYFGHSSHLHFAVIFPLHWPVLTISTVIKGKVWFRKPN
jgi:hypothetical protein